jgi:DNA (cytosine-5)-methyltransferase 1
MARLGLGDSWVCQFANDFDPGKAAAYRANFPDAWTHLHEGDVWALHPEALPGQVDLAWASSPCQDFSLAGARAGLAGGRSSAFFGFWRLMQLLDKEGRAPRAIVIENVAGLLSSHAGADFEALCAALAERGYRFGALEIDAACLLPQSRVRVFIVACRDAPAALQGPSPFHGKAIRAAFERLPEALRRPWVWWGLGAPPLPNHDLAALLEPDDAVAWRSEVETAELLALMDDRHADKVEAAKARGGRQVGAVFRRIRNGEQRAEIRFDGLAGCLRTPGGGSSRQFLAVVEDGQVRTRLVSPREAARLMGLPEDYRLPKSAHAALEVVGDGVAVPVVRHLAQALLEPLLRARPEIVAA